MIEIILIPYMAVLSRMIGGWGIKLPKFIKTALYVAPFGMITYMLYSPAVPITPVLYLPYVALAVAMAMTGKAAGHGRGISLFEPMKPDSKPEKVEYLILWLMPLLPVWLYKALVLALCEAIVWVGISYALSTWLMLGLLCRPAAYYIGWSMWRHAENNGHIRRTKVNDHSEVYISYMPDFIGQPTAIGEFLTGAFAGMVLVAVL